MIGIQFFTCARPVERGGYAHQALDSLGKHGLRCEGEKLWLHIADDGSSQEFRDSIRAHAQTIYGERTSISNSEGRGYGASYNLATQAMHERADLLLPLEDDWEMLRDFDLSVLARVLRAGHIDCIRMAYIGYTAPLRSEFVFLEGQHFLQLDPQSPERHVFAGGPRLETREFQRTVGLWPEGLGAGATEFEIAGRPEARRGIAWPITAIRPHGDLFTHIGSLQAVRPDDAQS